MGESSAGWSVHSRRTHVSVRPLLADEAQVVLQPNEWAQRPYPWGDGLTPDHCKHRQTKIETTNAVGSFTVARSPYGCEEMCGNVWEWTRSRFGESPHVLGDGRESANLKLYEQAVLCGGAFWSEPHQIGCIARARMTNHFAQ